MIDLYKIKIEDNEEILYLYINYNYEFGNFSNKKLSILQNIREYIINHKIKFNGNKIKLVVSGIVLCTIMLTNSTFNYNDSENYLLNRECVSSVIFDSENQIKNDSDQNVIKEQKKEIQKEDTTEEIKKTVNNSITTTNEIENNNTVENEMKEQTITLYRSNGQIINLSLNDYLIGVVAAEMPASFNSEALKTQAIVSRTYAFKLYEQNRKLTDKSSTQNYKDLETLKKYWGNDYNKYYDKVRKAVYETNNIVIKYNNNLIDVVFHSTSNGFTEDASNVWGNNIPYLKQVNSEFDKNSTQYHRQVKYTYDDISQKLGINVNIDTNVVIYKNESNRVSIIYLDGIAFTGINFRKLLNLRSTDFDITKNIEAITITTRGYGHGVGMSQYGANYLANNGYNYESIIKYYYTGVYLDKI